MIFVAPQKLNFNGTLRVPDTARRLYPGQHIVFFTFKDPWHNPYVKGLWPDVTYISLRGVPHALRKALTYAFHTLGAKTREELWQEAAQAVVLPPTLENGYASYFRLPAAPSVTLAPHLRKRVTSKLSSRPICNLYLKATSDPRLSGAPFASYRKTIELVMAAGYQILLTGDVPLPKDDYTSYLYTARDIGVDAHLFSAFAATEARIFIGDNGGGVMFSHLNPMPRLVLNVWPPYTIWDAKMLHKNAGGVANSEEQITAAVEAFLQGLGK